MTRTRTTYTKREIILNERTMERIEEQAYDRGVSFHAAAEAMLEEMLETLEGKLEGKRLSPDDPKQLRFMEFFDRRALRAHEEIEGAMSATDVQES